jgi:hypothetical protein
MLELKEKSMATELRMEERSLTLAILKTLTMWSDPKYPQFLRQNKPGSLDKDWFEWFVGDWRVARTIKEGKLEHVRRYLDRKFRQKLAKGDGASHVDRAARDIKKKCWSAGKDGKASLPLSLVSKIGFFLKPNTLVPYDTFARRGLKKLQRRRGVSRSKIESYGDYLHAFDAEFALVQGEIRDALTQPWVTAVAKRLECPIEKLQSPSLKRKIFDDYLMEIGGRKQR